MKDTLNSFLMIGQSNMAGRGFLKDVKPIYNQNIHVLINGRWQVMWEPINPDRPTSGIGLAASFAGAWCANNPDKQIGLIPCAEGGSSLEDWSVGGVLFENALFQAKLAQRSSKLQGIIWHQGENDSFAGRFSNYALRLSAFVEALREQLGEPDIPFISGDLGDYLSEGRYGPYFTEYKLINEALLGFSSQNPHCFFVTASQLSANPDGLHFDAASLRKFGLRYFDAFTLRQNILKPAGDEAQRLEQIYNRSLTNAEQIAVLEIDFGSGKMSLQEYEKKLSTLKP
ncbi:sialate O-acetylesterase [Pedobacter lithocola]|uniref:Sialate O-acetylesterase n=1 Tax=Pedobacter lithocola TaxID=1908239 RepID=A0ABV8P6Z2_9SPHI